MLGRYIRIAANDAFTGVNNYPDKPFLAKEEKKPKVMTDSQMERIFGKIANALNKKVSPKK